MLVIRLSADIENRLAALAEATGRTKTFYAREAIIKHLGNLEGIYLTEHEQEMIRARDQGEIPLTKKKSRRV
jgi:RHH-type rel operon transcriptional repressor/antitoxin RelB